MLSAGRNLLTLSDLTAECSRHGYVAVESAHRSFVTFHLLGGGWARIPCARRFPMPHHSSDGLALRLKGRRTTRFRTFS